MSDTKRRSQLETTRAVWRRLRPFRGRIVFSTTLATASALTTLYIPRLIGRAVDLIVGPNQVDFHGIGRIAIGIVLCALAVAVCQQLMALTNNSVAFAASRKLREEAFAKLQTLPLKYIDSQPYGDVVGRLASDVEQFADGLLLALTQFFSGVASIVGVLVFMFATNVWIALVVVALTPISLVVAGAIARRSFNLFGRRSILQGHQTAFASETSSCRRVAIAFGREERLADAYDELDEELSRASFGATFVSSLANPATRFVNGLVYMTVGVVGAFAVARGALSVGQLVVFLSYSEQYAKPFNEISGVATEFQNALACAGRIFEFLEAESEEPDPSDALAPTADRALFSFGSAGVARGDRGSDGVRQNDAGESSYAFLRAGFGANSRRRDGRAKNRAFGVARALWHGAAGDVAQKRNDSRERPYGRDRRRRRGIRADRDGVSTRIFR